MNNQEVKEFLIESEILSEKQIEKINDKIFADGEGDFLEIALDFNFIEPNIAREILAMMWSIPQVDLEQKIIDLETYSILPEPIAREKEAVVFKTDENNISVAIANFDSLEELKKIFPKKIAVEYFLAEIKDVRKKILEYQKLLRENLDHKLFSVLPLVPKLANFGFHKYDEIPEEYFQEISDDYYAEKFLKSLFEYALLSQAEYLYLDCEDDNYGIYFRIFSERYKIMEISKDSAVSLIIKLKKFANINIQNKSTIKEANFKAELFEKKHDVQISFIQTNVGTSVAIQIDRQIVFPFNFSDIIPAQQEIYFKSAEKNNGLILVSEISSFVSLAELESKKNKEIYSITKTPVEYKIPTINHLTTKPGEKINLLVAQVLRNRPDTVFLDAVTKSLIPIIMNFVTTGKKVFLELERSPADFIEVLLETKFEKSRIIKNISYIINHTEFKELKLEEQKKYRINRSEKQKILKFISEKELLEKLRETNLISQKIKKVEQIDFTTQRKKKFFGKKNNKAKVPVFARIIVKGIFEISETLENLFIAKKTTHQIKAKINKLSKKAILENALMISIQGRIDIKNVLKFLNK